MDAMVDTKSRQAAGKALSARDALRDSFGVWTHVSVAGIGGPAKQIATMHRLAVEGKRWISETLFDDLGFRMTFAVDRVLYETQTEHQHLVLFEHAFFGKVLMLDGATQVTSKDEFIYHEMMTHVPILAHGHAREVLIIGGGDCGIAEEALKHASVKRLTQVEIDASVVEFSK